MLILSNDDVRKVLTIEDTIAALRESYADTAAGIAVCRPRIDFRMPTRDTSHYYLWSTMDGGSTRTGYLASRMVSDLRYSETYNGVETSEEYCIRPGLFFGVVFLFRMENAEPLALMKDLPDQHRFLRLGPSLATHPRFPDGTNVEFAVVEAPDRVRILIWERGVGPTHASGKIGRAHV